MCVYRQLKTARALGKSILSNAVGEDKTFDYKLPDDTIREKLSLAHVQAIAAQGGFTCDEPSSDYQSVDLTIGSRQWIDPSCEVADPKLDVQVKATSVDYCRSDHFAFPLKIKNYNDLRTLKRMCPIILIVLALPTNPEEWLAINENNLVARRCCYWVSLKGSPSTDNTSSCTVHLPRSNILTPDSLKEIMIKASRLEDL